MNQHFADHSAFTPEDPRRGRRRRLRAAAPRALAGVGRRRGQPQAEPGPDGLRRTHGPDPRLGPAAGRPGRGHLRRRHPADRRVEEEVRRTAGAGQGLRGLPQAAGGGEVRGRGGHRRRPALARADEQGGHAGRQARLLREAAGPQLRRGPRDPRAGPPEQAGHAARHAGRLDRHLPPQHGGDPGGPAGQDPRGPLLDQPQLPAQRADRHQRRPDPRGAQLGLLVRPVAAVAVQELLHRRSGRWAVCTGDAGWRSATATWPTWAPTV